MGDENGQRGTRIAVVMAGGSGERFWPVSRKLRPKQLLRLTHPTMTLLEEAIERITPVVDRHEVFVATSELLREAVASSGLTPVDHVLAEPMKRNTLGCLVWVYASIRSRYQENWKNTTIAVLTADHKIDEPKRFQASVELALEVASRGEHLVTIGIRPTRPETGYGYLVVGDVVPGHQLVYEARAFREKPSLSLAEEYVAQGNSLWNSGMFFWRLDRFIAELTSTQPEAAIIADELADALSLGNRLEAEKLFAELPNISIDYALMERTNRVRVVEASFPWDDVGAWDAVDRSMPSDMKGNVLHGDVIEIDSTGNVCYNDANDMLLCVVDVHGLVIALTDDAVLVCPKTQAQRVRDVIKLVSDKYGDKL